MHSSLPALLVFENQSTTPEPTTGNSYDDEYTSTSGHLRDPQMVGCTYKENMDLNRSETPKLNVEPQKMKRKKKDGAYDVRKSLAWDRAFFTEEGVLNPIELCMLNEGCGNSGPDLLPTTDEEGTKFPCNFASVSKSAKVIRETPCKLPPSVNSHERENDGNFSLNHVSLAQDYHYSTSEDMQKILSDRVGSKRGGYSRELVYSSLKRPGSESSEKFPMKVSRLPKIPIPRSGSHLAAKANKTNVLGASNSKKNQTAQTEDTVHGSGTVKVSSTNSKSSACKANTSSLISSGRCKADSDLETRSSSDLQSPKVMNASHALEVFPTSVSESDGLRALGSYLLSRSNGVHLPQNDQCSVRNILSTQGKPLKPSGLRMPSPSLGFFGQPRSSASNHSSHKVIQASNIPEKCIPSLQKQSTSYYMYENIRGKLDGNIVPKVEEKVPYCCPRSELVKEKKTIVDGDEGYRECLKRKLDRNNLLKEEVKTAHSFRNCEVGKEDVLNANMCKSNGNEKLKCQSSPYESADQTNKCVAGEDKVHAVDVLAPFSNEILSHENCDIKLYTSEVDFNLVADDKETSEIDSKPQSHGLLVEQPSLVKVAPCNSAEEVSRMENHECLSDTQFSPDLPSKSSNDHAVCDVATSNSLASSLFNKQVVTGDNELNHRTFAGKAHIEHTSDNSDEETETVKVIEHTLHGESGFSHEFLSGGPLSTVANNDSTDLPFARSESPSSVVNREHGDLIAAEVDKMPKKLSPGNIEGPSLDENVVIGSNKTDVNQQYVRKPWLQKLLPVAYQISQDHHDSKFDNNLMLQKNISSEEIREETVSTDEKPSLFDPSGSNNSSFSIQVPLAVQESADVAQHTPLSPVETATRREHDGWLSDPSVTYDETLGVQAASSVSALALTREDQTSGVIFSCLNKESDLVHQKNQVSTNNSDVMDEGFGRSVLQCVGNGVSQRDGCPTAELQHELDKGICLTENSSSTKTTAKYLDHRPHNLTVMAPSDAVPFSDEWLAAMEAAGEGILALKSGAVQNSPPNKSLPEPGPWSPVKRKSNVVGPFDCTKFTKILPSSSGE